MALNKEWKGVHVIKGNSAVTAKSTLARSEVVGKDQRGPIIQRNILKGGTTAIATIAQRKVYFSTKWVAFGMGSWGKARGVGIRVINR
jgi:hypothetical protein